MVKHLHIVTHDVPWPADFGGVMDLFYKIKALHSFGIKIHLHCFTGGRKEQPNLEKYCESVHYYNRKKGLQSFSLTTPYIVQSRNNPELLRNLQQDQHPILFEGIHCTYFLQGNHFKGRKLFVRLHNVEYKYYEQLAKHESSISRKLYFKMESRLLRQYEKKLANKAMFWAVSKDDAEVYKNEFHAAHIHFVPVFLPWEEVSSLPGKGNFCLYHGNLSINENELAATWLLEHVFKGLEIPFTIAGKNPSEKLRTAIAKIQNATLVPDPSEPKLNELINAAQINILPSFNKTGIKLKLLNALYNGRYCIVNKEAVAGSGLEDECQVANSTDEYKRSILSVFEESFTEQKMQHRDAALKNIYNTEKNVLKLIAWIY